MSVRTTEQDRALAWYVQSNNLRLMLASHPKYYFVNDNNEEVKESIVTIMNKYKEYKREEK